jgi:dihydroneopterin aldolase
MSSSSARVPYTGDAVRMEGLEFYGHHGVLAAETALGQRFVIDATMWSCLRAAGASDDLKDTVDYTRSYASIRGIVEGPPRKLIESVAEEIAASMLAEHPSVTEVRVSVHKPNVALRGTLRTVGVTIERARSMAPS